VGACGCLRPPRRSASATRRASPASPSANVVLSHDAEREDLARGVGGHEPPAGPREQLLADVARLDDHLAVVVDQDGHLDVPAGDARELVALPVGDLDEVVASAEEIEQHLGLAQVRAVAQPVELRGQASSAADLRRFVERPRSGRYRPGALRTKRTGSSAYKTDRVLCGHFNKRGVRGSLVS
jgi:hypothetical protein